MINLNNLTLTRGRLCLFSDVNLIIHTKQKIGLVGANGSGKSSLMALLQRQLEPNGGDIQFNAKLRIAHVIQETLALPDLAIDYVLQGNAQVWEIEQQIRTAEEKEDYTALAYCHMKFSEIDGYRAASEAAELLDGLGFSKEGLQTPVADFSGGWRMRLNLARALLCPSDLLLLDEPTNHLDLETIVWLEKFLRKYVGTLIVISHDRDFLDHVVTSIAHIEQQQIKMYTGDYSSFETQRAQALELQQALFEKQQRQIAHKMRFVNRFRAKASKAKQAQSRLKAIDRMEKVAAVQATSSFNFDFFEPKACGSPLVSFRDGQCGYDKVILDNVNVQLLPGDRIGLLGVNGSGKSTLIKTLVNEISPLHGDVVCAQNLKIGYFSQHQLDYLEADKSALQHMQQIAHNETPQNLRQYLGKFAFSHEFALRPIAKLSGGERARLALALLIWQRPNLLLLDEPTNHLDLEVRMSLMLALQNYSGALVLVSHDRYLLNSIADCLWLINKGTVTEFIGSLDDYIDSQNAA